MTGLAITITDRGRAALIAARGTNPITITHIGVTAANFVASPDAQALPGEIKRLTTFSGEASDAYTIHITIRDDSLDVYELRGFALYLADGTLFGIYGNGPTLLMEKASASMLLLAVDIRFSESDAHEITFGATNFLNPPATTERDGVVELATEAEAAAGTDTARAVTPKAMLSAVTGWLNTRFGNGAPSEFIKGILGSASAAVLRTALAIKSSALKDEGAGNGLDADKLDGREGTYYLDWGNHTGIPSAFPPVSHGHPVSDVTGLQSALDARLLVTNYTASDVLNKLRGVDGSGSGLDADLLDGLDSAYYTAIAARLGYTPANRAGDSFTGNIAVNGYLVWHAGNDGGGSGMDADTLDGQHGSYYANISERLGYNPANRAGDKFSGPVELYYENTPNVSLTQTSLGGVINVRSYTGTSFISLDARPGPSQGIIVNGNIVYHAGNDGSGSGLDADLIDGIDSQALLTGRKVFAESEIDAQTFNGFACKSMPGATSTVFQFSSGGSAGIIQQEFFYNTAQDGYRVRNKTDNTTWTPWGYVVMAKANQGHISGILWHASNDGAGSGLDADMLDGQHASAFASAGALDAKLDAQTFTNTARVIAVSSAANGGYRVWSDGFKECWGTATVPANGEVVVAYPITFQAWSNAMCAGGWKDSGAQENGPWVCNTSTVGCTLFNSIGTSLPGTWRAWGY